MSSNDAVGELICPITGEVFLDPVLLVGDGHTYEREAAERWLAKHATSPLSGQPLPPHGLDLVPNHALRKQASALLERRPDLRPVPGAWCAKEDAKGAAGAGADASPSAPDLQGAGEGEEDEVGAAKRRAQAEAGFSSRVDASSDSPSAPPLFHGGGFLVGTRGGGALSFDLSTRARDSRWERPLAPSSRREHVPFLAASDDGSVFASGISNSSTVHVWRPPTAIDAFPAAPIAVTARDWATCAAISRAGDWAVVAGRSERLDAYRVGDGGGGAGAGAVIVSSESLRADADAPWHKDFVTCVARDGDASVVYGAEDWTLRRADVGAGTAGAVVGALTSVVTAVDVARDAGLIIVGADDGRTFFFDARAGDAPVHAREPDALDHPETSRVAAVAARSDGFGFFVGTPGGAHLLEGPRASFRARADAGGVEKMGSVVAAAAVPGGSGLVVATGGRGLGGRGRPGAWSASWEDGAVVDAAGGAWTEDDAPPTSVVAFEATPLAAATREAAVGDENRPKKGFLSRWFGA